jgi:hypothetical protein
MPVFHVTYTNAREAHVIQYETEWITPDSYDQAMAYESFQRTYPNTVITRFLPFTFVEGKPEELSPVAT